MKELDSVVLVKSIPGFEIPVGSKGVVLMVYNSGTPAYEVEFFDASGNTIEHPESGQFTFTVDGEHVQLAEG